MPCSTNHIIIWCSVENLKYFQYFLKYFQYFSLLVGNQSAQINILWLTCTSTYERVWLLFEWNSLTEFDLGFSSIKMTTCVLKISPHIIRWRTGKRIRGVGKMNDLIILIGRCNADILENMSATTSMGPMWMIRV